MSRHSLVSPLPRLGAFVIVVTVVASCGAPMISRAPSRTAAEPSAASPVASAGSAGTRACEPAASTLAASAAASSTAPWWRDRIFYEVFVRSFADSDGDGIGDLRGLTERLDYLNDGDPATTDDLGVTALWLMPVAESPNYHGYDVTDYKAIEPDYGTADDFHALMTAARERGIAVIGGPERRWLRTPGPRPSPRRPTIRPRSSPATGHSRRCARPIRPFAPAS